MYRLSESISNSLEDATSYVFHLSPEWKLHGNALTVFFSIGNIRFPRCNMFSDLLFSYHEETQGYFNLEKLFIWRLFFMQQLCSSLFHMHPLISGSFCEKHAYQKGWYIVAAAAPNHKLFINSFPPPPWVRPYSPVVTVSRKWKPCRVINSWKNISPCSQCCLIMHCTFTEPEIVCNKRILRGKCLDSHWMLELRRHALLSLTEVNSRKYMSSASIKWEVLGPEALINNYNF